MKPGPRLWVPVALIGLWSLACMAPHRGGGVRRAELGAVESKLDQVLANQALQQAALDELVAASRRQGSGEITLFFGPMRDSLYGFELERLIAFLDRVAFEARGREVIFVAVGSATEWRDPGRSRALSLDRAEGLRPIVDSHLVHIPHRWLSRYGVGDAAAPVGAGGRTWRHVRLVAVYDEAVLPALPQNP